MNTEILDYRAWLEHAHAGQEFTYHIGSLAYDRVPNAHTSCYAIDVAIALDHFARLVADDAEMGYVTLSQRRLRTNCYVYLATRTTEALPPEEEVA